VTGPLKDLAEGTGGAFFHNDNDFVSGFTQVTAPPQVVYLLGFSPNDFKPNGAYHSLKVQVTSGGKYEIQARRGYLAPTKIEEAQATPPDPIETALYSGGSSQAFPIALHAESSRTPNSQAMLSVSVHVDIQHLEFQKQQDHYVGTLIFRTALFDSHQQYVTGDERNLDLNLDEKRFADLAHSGINAVTHLAVAPGDYVLREVVEEKATGKLSVLGQPIQVQ